MTDFLRRLAPPRETDATRAVAVLPSRFDDESPLRATIGLARPVRHPGDDEAPLSLDAASAPAGIDALAARRHPVSGIQPSQAVLRTPGRGLARHHNGNAASSSHAPIGAKAPDIDGADLRAFEDGRGAISERVRPASPELQGLTAALATRHGSQGSTAPDTQPDAALPLSQAILAQRMRQARDDSDSQVVHVTIGRIDVVANTAPAPAVRRSPTPRQGTVTLADYLRGGNEGRR